MQQRIRFRPFLVMFVTLITFLMVGKAAFAETFRVGSGDPWKYGKFLGSYINLVHGSASPGGKLPQVITVSSKSLVVKADNLNVRSGPGTSYEILASVDNGIELKYISEDSGWYNVILKDGTKGWVSGDFVDAETVEPPKDSPEEDSTIAVGSSAVITGNLVNIRSGPGTSYGIVTQLSEGTIVEIRSMVPEWYKIKTSDGKEGWIADFLLKVEEESSVDNDENGSDSSEKGTQAVITGNIVNVRSGPDTSYDIITKVTQDTVVLVISKTPEWYQIVTPEGKAGWVASFLLKEQNLVPSRDGSSEPPQEEEQEPTNEEDSTQDNDEDNPAPEEPDQDGSAQNPPSQGEETPEPDSEEPGTVVSGVYKLTEMRTISEGNIEKIVLEADGAIAYNVFRLSNPDRIVFDLENIEKDEIPDSLSGLSNWVSGIRVGQFSLEPAVTRIVIDLNKLASYNPIMSEDEMTLTIELFEPSLKGKTIVVDAGHGGYDPGAVGVTGLKEKGVNIDIAQRLEKMLTAMGADVVMTRNDDTFVSLTDRAEKANNLQADLFISVHSNSSDYPDTNGTCTYYYAPSSDPVLYAQAEKRNSLAVNVQSQLAANLGTKNLGERQANFSVLRNTKMPSILVETAFLSNKSDESLLKESSFREKVAESVAQGILNYTTSN